MLELRPQLIAFAWARAEQDLQPYIDRAHAAGCKVPAAEIVSRIAAEAERILTDRLPGLIEK